MEEIIDRDRHPVTMRTNENHIQSYKKGVLTEFETKDQFCGFYLQITTLNLSHGHAIDTILDFIVLMLLLI